MSQTHTPRAKARINRMMNDTSDSSGASSQYSGKAIKVPNVPGAFCARPLPKPNEIRCAGWLNNSRQPGSTQPGPTRVLSEMFIAAVSKVESVSRRIVHDAAATRNNFSDAGQWQVEPCADAHYLGM